MPENQNLPGYVTLFDAGPLGGAANYSNGFLPAAFQPTRLRDQRTPVLDLLPPTDFADGQRAALDLVRDPLTAPRDRFAVLDHPDRLQRTGDFLYLEHLQLITFLDVIEILQRQTALKSGLDLFNVILESLQGIKFTGPDHDVIAQQTHM